VSSSRSRDERLAGLEGVFSFPVTPMHGDRTIDLDGFQSNIEAICATELAAVFVCCGTGEFHALSLGEYRTLVQAAHAVIRGRKPLFAGAGMGPAQAAEFAHAAQDAGADGILALPPYLITPDPSGLAEYYRQLARSLDIAVILYQRGNAVFTAQALDELSLEPNIVGFKDGLGDLELLRRFTILFGDRFAWMSGMPTAEMTFEAFYACGVRSFSSAIANFAPSVGLDFHRAVVDGDASRRTQLLRTLIIPLCGIRDRRAGYAVSYVKAAMNLLGLPAGPVRPPLVALDDGECEELAAILRANGFLPGA
jgi:5-dehydro-4-deoxyglucarate dehydratase